MTHLLLVEDDLTFSTMLSTWLRKHDFDVTATASVAQAVKLCSETRAPYELVLSDLRLPDHDGLYLLRWLRTRGATVPFIVMTSYAEVGNAVEAMKLGATDYISKPIQPDILLEKLHDALKRPATPAVATGTTVQKEEKAKGRRATPAPATSDGKTAISDGQTTSYDGKAGVSDGQTATGIEGHSPAARELYRLAALVAPTPMSVLILGASGTGKEYVARRIHELSRRADGPFVALDCGALTKELAASELFGHAKGAFTGAISDKAGAFEQAEGGTLFLDEIGNLSYEVQVQLLRALQERRIRRVGDGRERAVDIRLVSATNEDLTGAIARGAWREDLFHRINEFTLHIPLLRERPEDLEEFARYFLDRANDELGTRVEGFTPDALHALRTYPWPGNLREMRNLITRATLLSQAQGIITPDTLSLPAHTTTPHDTPNIPHDILNTPHDTPDIPQLGIKPSPDDERTRIAEALRQTGGNKSRAAQLLGVDRKTLYNKLKALGM